RRTLLPQQLHLPSRSTPPSLPQAAAAQHALASMCDRLPSSSSYAWCVGAAGGTRPGGGGPHGERGVVGRPGRVDGGRQWRYETPAGGGGQGVLRRAQRWAETAYSHLPSGPGGGPGAAPPNAAQQGHWPQPAHGHRRIALGAGGLAGGWRAVLCGGAGRRLQKPIGGWRCVGLTAHALDALPARAQQKGQSLKTGCGTSGAGQRQWLLPGVWEVRALLAARSRALAVLAVGFPPALHLLRHQPSQPSSVSVSLASPLSRGVGPKQLEGQQLSCGGR
ncbi:unnamed protein product, partial [Boreogadus saida]